MAEVPWASWDDSAKAAAARSRKLKAARDASGANGPYRPGRGPNPNPPGTPAKTLPGQLVSPGGGSVATAISGRSTAEVAKTQQFLRNRGYNIRVDGIMGPSTSSALNNYQMGGGKRDASAWTSANRPVDDGRPDNPRTDNNSQYVDRRDKTSPGPKGPKGKIVDYRNAGQLRHDAWVKSHPKVDLYGKTKVKGKTGSLTEGSSSNQGGPGSVYDRFDPDVMARASMEAKYGPQIAELLRQEKQAGLAGDYRVGEIEDMYGTYVKDIKNRNIDSANSRQGMVAATDDLAESIGAGIALNADEQQSLNQTGAIDTTYASQIAQSGDDYDSRMASAAQGGGVFAQQQAQGVRAANIDGIQDKRGDLLAQKGSDLVATRQALQQWQQEMGQRQYEFEVGAKSDRTKDNIEIAKLRAANAMLPAEMRMKELELEKMISEISYTKAQTTRALRPDPVDPADKPFPKNFVDLDTPNRGELQSDIIKQIAEQGVTGTPRIVELINARLRGMGYKPVANKAVGEFAYQTAKAAGARGVSKKYWKL